MTSADDLGAQRSAAQYLHRPQRLAVDGVVRHLVGVQAQVLSGSGLALRARTADLIAVDVDRARAHDRTVVRTWAMRGTLHLVAAEDYGWLVPLVVEPAIANAHRRLRQEGVPADQPATAVRLIGQMLEREGPLTRSEIAERLRGKGIRTAGQAIAHLVWLAAAEGVICYGPDRGRDQCFVLVRDWIGEKKPRPREEAAANLVLRYLVSHGPAAPADLSSWSGVPLSQIRRAWQSVSGRLVAIRADGEDLWRLRSTGQAEAGVVRLLPAFDEYLLGWRDRSFAVPSGFRTRINRGGGWLHPVVIADGQVVATWEPKAGSSSWEAEVYPFGTLEARIRNGIVKETADIRRFLAGRRQRVGGEEGLPPPRASTEHGCG